MSKKVVAMVMLVVLVASILVACGNNNIQGGGSGTDGGGSATKIIVSQSKVEITDQLEMLARDYQEETGIEVEVWGTTGDDYFQQLRTRLASNQGPTVFGLAPGAESSTMIAYLEDLGDLSFVDDVLDESLLDKQDGKIVGIPYTMEGFGIVYNKDELNEDDMKDLDSLIAKMESDYANGVTTLGLSSESYFLIGHILNTPFALQENPKEFMENVVSGEQTITDVPEFQEFAKLDAAIKQYGYNPLEMNYDRQIGDFAAGRSIGIHQGNWAASMFVDYDMNFEKGMAGVPLMGNDKLSVSVPTCWYVNSQASDAEIQAGKDFLEWMYTSEEGQRYLLEEFGFLPILKDLESPNVDVLSEEVLHFAEEHKTLEWATNYYPAGMVDVHLVPVAQQFFTSDMSEQEFLQALQDAFVAAGQ